MKFDERFVLLTSKILYVDCKSDIFVYHPDEASEASGYKQYGVYFLLEKEVKQKRNYYNLAKIYDGLTSYLDSLRPGFDHAEFDFE